MYTTFYTLITDKESSLVHIPSFMKALENTDIPEFFDIPESFADVDEQGYSHIRLQTENWCVWDKCKENMTAISLQFPHTLFTLECESEERGLFWKEHYKNGKYQYASGKIVYEKCKFKKETGEDTVEAE